MERRKGRYGEEEVMDRRGRDGGGEDKMEEGRVGDGVRDKLCAKGGEGKTN